MAIQWATTVRNAMVDAIEATILTGGTPATMKIRTGTKPANAGSSDTGTVLSTINLPADFLTAASSGTKSISGTWSDASADATGTAGHFRIYNSAGVCMGQGSIGTSGSGADMIVADTAITAGQVVDITAFTIVAPGA